MSKFQARTVSEIYTFIQGTMPLGRAGALSNAEYLAIVKLILQSNQLTFSEPLLVPDVKKLDQIKIKAPEGMGM